MSADDQKQRIESGLRKALNLHGHAFQYRVIREIERLTEDRHGFPWWFLGAEVPVAVQRFNTHVDFILKHRDGHTFLVVECKRANPALRTWCFARAPYVWHHEGAGVNLEQMTFAEGRVWAGVGGSFRGRGPYHVWKELKGGQKGDSSGGKVANDAIKQVVVASQGFAATLSRSNAGLRPQQPVVIIPAIITTAHLWVSEVELSEADLESGELGSAVPMGAREVSWLWYEHNVSPTMRHDERRGFHSDTGLSLSRELEAEHTRAIAIVNASQLEEFLRDVSD